MRQALIYSATFFLILVFGWTVQGKEIPSDWSTMIVGGIEATKGEFPFIVGLRKENHHCGGSIINSEWILTAAHCSTGAENLYTIVAGDHINNEFEGTEQNRTVSRIVIHPHYDALTHDNDIALMKVVPPFEFNHYVQLVELASSGFIPPHTAQIVAGWGRLTEGGSSSNVLMKVRVPFVSDEDCNEAYAGRITESMTCAGEGGKDACQGDSGGPLLCPVGGRKILFGLVSWGTGCARPDKPGVYAKVSHFESWITGVIA